MAKKRSSGVLHLLTPAATLQALREPTAGVDLMDRHSLHRHTEDSRRVLRRGISHFLSPQLQVLIKEKPRIALSEKADFAELLSEEPSGRPIQELSLELMGRSFMIRRRVATGSAGAAPQDVEEEVGVTRPPVPPDLPMEAQTTNKMSPAFAKKVRRKGDDPRPALARGVRCSTASYLVVVVRLASSPPIKQPAAGACCVHQHVVSNWYYTAESNIIAVLLYSLCSCAAVFEVLMLSTRRAESLLRAMRRQVVCFHLRSWYRSPRRRSNSAYPMTSWPKRRKAIGLCKVLTGVRMF